VSLSVTILIPAHNEADDIEAVVASCLAQSYPAQRVLVVADSCSDTTVEIARAAGAEVIEVSCADKAAAQNAALALVDTEVVVGIDGDTRLAPDAVEHLVGAIEAGFDGTCAHVVPSNEHETTFVRARLFAYTLGRRWWRLCQRAVGRVQVMSGCAYAFRTEALRTVGGVPTDIIVSNDMNLTWELYRAGYRLTYTPEAVSFTLEPEDWRVYRKQMSRWAAGYFQNVAKHRRQLSHPAAALVVLSALYDLISLPLTYGLLAWGLLRGGTAGWLWAWVLVHHAVIVTLVAKDLGWRRSLRTSFDYLLVNVINKGIYLWTFIREWILGRHYASWTGRQGRGTVITPMSPLRRRVLGSAATNTAVAAGLAVIVALGATAAVRPETLRMPFVSSPATPPPPVEEEAVLVRVDVEEELAPSTTTTTLAPVPGPPQPEVAPASVPVLQPAPAFSHVEPAPTRRSAVVPRPSRTVRSPRPGTPASTTTTTSTVSEPTTTTPVPADSEELEESTESPTSPVTPPPPVVDGA
jgi:biofilm PGA synthesis N-glycosyltransferase PgaC